MQPTVPPALRPLAFGAARAVGLFRLARRPHRGELLVLTYHGVIDVRPETVSRAPWLYRNCVTAQQLRSHLTHLKRHYRVLSPSDFEEWVLRRPALEDAALVTFDDGCRSQAAVAAPILEETGVRAVFLLPTGLVEAASKGAPGWQWTEELGAWVLQHEQLVRLEWPRVAGMVPGLAPLPEAARVEQLIEMLLAVFWHLSPAQRADTLQKLQLAIGGLVDPARFPANRAGVSVLDSMTWGQAHGLMARGSAIGSHSVSHARLADLPLAAAQREIVTSANQIRERLGSVCRFFSFPYGGSRDYTSVHQGMLASGSYLASFTQTPGFNGRNTDRYSLRRIDIPGDCELDRFRYHTSGLRLLWH